MGHFAIGKKGFDVTTTGIQNKLVDSNYQTLLIAYAASGSIAVPATAVPGQLYAASLTIGQSVGFTPLIFFYTNDPTNISGQYIFAPTTQPGSFLINLIPGDPWIYYYPATGSPYTANYMYFVTYLPSQGVTSNAINAITANYFVAVANEGDNVATTPIQNLAFLSQTPTLHAQVFDSVNNVTYQTYTASATLTSGSSQTFTFPHSLGAVYPFTGVVKNYFDNFYLNSPSTLNFNLLNNMQSLATSVDSTNFYYTFTNNSPGSITINQTLEVTYFVQAYQFP